MPPRQKKERHLSQNNPPHFPFEEPPFRLSMGLLKAPIEGWFEIFDPEERAFQMEEKRRLLAIYHDDIFMADPSSFAASTEVLNLMLKHLPALRPDLYLRNHDVIKLKSHSKFKEEVWSTDLKKNGVHLSLIHI